MKVTFETEDLMEAKMLVKSSAMAGFIWELVHNSFKELEYMDIDTSEFRKLVTELLERFEINISDIYE